MIKGVNCPCCGYPTLNNRNEDEICYLCNWQDDGQDDPHADEIWGGPNKEYSLSEARIDFKKYLTMFSPNKDFRMISGDSHEEKNIKEEIIANFTLLMSDETQSEIVIDQINKLKLDEILRSKIDNVKKVDK